jgi:hypothetical protein
MYDGKHEVSFCLLTLEGVKPENAAGQKIFGSVPPLPNFVLVQRLEKDVL